MIESITIYLDVCCLNRPFDDWRQDRIRFEGQAILSILERVQNGLWQLVTSEVIDLELNKLTNPEKRTAVQALLDNPSVTIAIDEVVIDILPDLKARGFPS